MQSPELYGIVGGDECLLHLLKFQQRTSMKWYLITSLDDTSQVLSHFVHHYLHWILFHMTVGIAGTAKKNSFEISLESLLCSSSSLFNSWDRAWRLGGFRRSSLAGSLPLTGGIPTIPTLSREAVRCFISFWMAVSRLFSSLILFAICVWLSCPTAAAQPLDQPSWNLGKSLQMLHRFRKSNQQTPNSSISSNCWFLFSRRFLNCTYSWATSERVAWVCKLHLFLSSLRRFYLDLFEASCIEMNRAFRSHTANLSTMYIIVWNMHVRGKTYV